MGQCCCCKKSKSVRTSTKKGRTDGSVKSDAIPVNLNYISPYVPKPEETTSVNSVNFQSSSKGLPNTVLISPTVRNAPVTKKTYKVKKTGKYYDRNCLIPTYPTHSPRRGEVLLINNIRFKNEKYRSGAENDHKQLSNLFKQMSLKVTVGTDMKLVSMIDSVRRFSQKTSLKSVDMSIVIIMSHGNKSQNSNATEISGLDEKSIATEELIEFFNDKDCKAMINKPKIFIFQCCRGEYEEKQIKIDAQERPPEKPAVTNTLIAYSTLPGFVSHRSASDGTWYTSAFCEVFSQYAHEHHFEDLLKMVDEKLASFHKGIKQTTHYDNRGFKRCYLHPK